MVAAGTLEVLPTGVYPIREVAAVRLLLEGTIVLATVPTTGGWVATVHRPRR